jgi:hypothetical protein
MGSGEAGVRTRIGAAAGARCPHGSDAALMLLSRGFDRQPFVDLALIMGVMSFIGGVVLAGLIEQGVRSLRAPRSRPRF